MKLKGGLVVLNALTLTLIVVLVTYDGSRMK